MNRYIFVALLLMAWAYWELSGGASFAPEAQDVAEGTDEADEAVTDTDIPPPQDTATPEATGQDAAQPEPAPEVAQSDADDSPPVAALEQPGEEGQAADPVDEGLNSAAAFEANPLTTADQPPEPSPETAPDADLADAPADLRVVTGDRVNLREGPSTSFEVVDQLDSGTIIEVIEARDGWAHVQMQGTTQNGWMSADFLTALNG